MSKKIIQELLSLADVTINGPRPWDIQINDERFYSRVLSEHALGLGESYMEGWWECERLDDFLFRILRANLDDKVKKSKQLLFKLWLAQLINFQTKPRASIVGYRHYDLDHALFKTMLDSRMIYSCGYWKSANSLEDAQRDKLDLTCKKLMLQPGMRLLDIGCGWGGLAKYAAENYGVSVVGITISANQYHTAKNLCQALPIEIRLQDYRDLDETNERFDRIVSIGMFEHVGPHNYDRYMAVVKRCLTDEGIFLLHSIGSDWTVYAVNEWMNKYIFPNSCLPSIVQIGTAIEKKFVMEDWHNFGADYDKTLMAWRSNFEKNWPSLRDHYDDVFYRMWIYYLSVSAAASRARYMQLWQIVLTKKGLIGGYSAVR